MKRMFLGRNLGNNNPFWKDYIFLAIVAISSFLLILLHLLDC